MLGRIWNSCVIRAKSWSQTGSYAVLGMDDEQADHAHGFLHRDVGVVEERPVLVEDELVDERLAGRDEVLDQAGHAVLADGDLQAVPVDRGEFGEPVLDDDPHPVALIDLDHRAGHRAVEAPDVHLEVGEELALHRHRDQVELLGTVAERPGELGQVGVTTGTGGSPGFRSPGTSLPRSVGLPTGPPEPGRSRGYSSLETGAWFWPVSVPGAGRPAAEAISPAVAVEPVVRKLRLLVAWSTLGTPCQSPLNPARDSPIPDRGRTLVLKIQSVRPTS